MQAASQNRRSFPAFTGHFGKDRRIGCRGHRTSRQPRNFGGLRTQVAKALRLLLAGDKWRERKSWSRLTHHASDNSWLDAAQPGEDGSFPAIETGDLTDAPGTATNPAAMPLDDAGTLTADPKNGSWQFVAEGVEAANRGFADGVDGVSATGRAFRKLSADQPDVGLEILLGANVAGLFAFLQRPLIFRRVELAEVVDAGVLLRSRAGLDEVGDGDGGQHSRHGDGGQQDEGGGALVSVADSEAAIERVLAHGIGERGAVGIQKRLEPVHLPRRGILRGLPGDHLLLNLHHGAAKFRAHVGKLIALVGKALGNQFSYMSAKF